MAYWLNDAVPYNPSRQAQFFMDTDMDKNSLPTSTADGVPQNDTVTHKKVKKGSTALSILSGKVFILDSNDTWTEIGG